MNWLKEHLSEALGLLSALGGAFAWLLRFHRRVEDTASRLAAIEKTLDESLLLLDKAREDHENRLRVAEEKLEAEERQRERVLDALGSLDDKLTDLWKHLVDTSN